MKPRTGVAFASVASLAAVVLVTAGCTTRERTGTVAGPGLTVAPRSSTPDAHDADAAEPAPPATAAAGSADDTGSDKVSPVVATFEELTPKGTRVEFRACEQRVVALAKGKATVNGEILAVGDAFLAFGKGSFDVKGDGLAVFASVRTHVCEPVTTPGIRGFVLRAKASPEVTWAGGAMHAHLDSDGKEGALAYVGRLSGTASVAEHRHEGSWEVLAAIEGAGTFTIDGKPGRLAPRQVVVVPPGVAHSWTPDAGTSLSALQMYSPPGPEQRFKALASQKAPAARK